MNLLILKLSLQLPSGLITYLCCSISEQRRLFLACPQCPMHFTGSRQVAQLIKQVVPKLLASTGGPNTMVTTSFSEPVATAARISNLIENKGQCTALRHLVVGQKLDVASIDAAYKSASVVQEGKDALAVGDCASILAVQPEGTSSEVDLTSYTPLPSQPLVQVRVSNQLPAEIDEKWRRCFLDVTTMDGAELRNPAFLKGLAAWLNTEQPISLAVNAPRGDWELAGVLFESTGLVVYTVGDVDEKPALTAQARPQDGECFGEFAPRWMMDKVTSAPMVIPSPVAAYNAVYPEEFLLKASREMKGAVGSSGGLHAAAVRAWTRIECPLVQVGVCGAIRD